MIDSLPYRRVHPLIPLKDRHGLLILPLKNKKSPPMTGGD
jgi:hypothetical protein